MMNFAKFDDSASVTTDANSVSVGRFSLRKRELLLAVVAIVACVVVIVLALVLALNATKTSGDTSSCPSSSSPGAGGSTGRATGMSAADYCDTFECLQAAVYQKPILKEDVDPCLDFYSFACGNYAKHHEQTPVLLEVTPNTEISRLNRQLLEVYLLPDALSQPDSKDGDTAYDYEKKLQSFMFSCNSHMDKMDLRGTPLIKKVIQPMGGWWVFGDNVLDTFGLQETFIKASVSFHSLTFFNTVLKPNNNDLFQAIVEVDFGGGLLKYIYSKALYDATVVHASYKTYMRIIARMLCVDAGIQADDDTIETFAEDVFEVERTLILYSFPADFNVNSHDVDQLWTLGKLNEKMNGTIDVVPYFKGIFDKHPADFNEGTKIAVANPFYFEHLGSNLRSFLDGANGTRKLHNYLMWSVIHRFVGYLSWDYIHAEVKMLQVLTGASNQVSVADHCFTTGASKLFGDALNAYYIRHILKKEGKQEAETIVANVKAVLLESIRAMPWMTSKNRKYAVAKIENSLQKIGFPAKLMDVNYLNSLYASVQINRQDFFGNILALNGVKRDELNKAYGTSTFRGYWPSSLFQPQVFYDNPWQDFVVTSAVLQNPLFHHNGPVYYNYGGVGSSFATQLIHAFDEIGSFYTIGGSHYDSWWDSSTDTNFDKIKQCAGNAWKTSDPGDFHVRDTQGNDLVVSPDSVVRNTSSWTSLLLATSSGVRTAYKAYKAKETSMGVERVPPTLTKYTPDQMFFISYAQANCQNAPDIVKYYQFYQGVPPNKEMVNLALQQVPEFKTAFQCPAKQGVAEPCLLFGQ